MRLVASEGQAPHTGEHESVRHIELRGTVLEAPVLAVLWLPEWKQRKHYKPEERVAIQAKDMLAGRQPEIHAERDRKLETARKQRQLRRQKAA